MVLYAGCCMGPIESPACQDGLLNELTAAVMLSGKHTAVMFKLHKSFA